MDYKQEYDALKKKVDELEAINSNLVANEKKFQSFFNHAGISICMLDPTTGQIIEFNDVAHQNLGYTREEFGNLTIHDIDSSVNKASISERRKEYENGRHIFESVHRTRNGDMKNMLISYVPVEVDGKRMIQSVHMDITNQKYMELALKESEERYRAIIDLIPNGIIIVDKGIILFANNGYLKMMGFSNQKDVIGRHLSEIMRNSHVEGLDQDELIRFVENNIPRHDFVLEFQRPDGKKVFNRMYSTRIDYMGKPVVLSVIDDITRDKEKANELILKEKRFREIVENSKDAIFLTDFDDNIIDANQHACDSLGYTREELLSLPMLAIDISVIPEENDKLLAQLTHKEKDELQPELLFHPCGDVLFPLLKALPESVEPAIYHFLRVQY